MNGGTYSTVADMGTPASDDDFVFGTVEQASAERERAALSGVPPMIAAELAEHLNFYRALPAEMSEADKDRAFYSRFPEADTGGILLGDDTEGGQIDAIEGFA